MSARTIEASVVYLNAPYQLELRKERLATDIGAREILCETLVTAISPGTELAAYRGLPALRPGAGYPRLQGYCNVARVLAAGGEVREVTAGDRVLSFTSHRSHFVINADEVLLVLPQTAAAESLACTYLFHLGYDAVLKAAVRPGSRVLVLGLGALGLASVAMAAVAGGRVFGLSDQAFAGPIARAFGAAAVFSRRDLDGLRAALTDQLADVIIVTTNAWKDWATALEMAALHGTIACLGFPGRGEPPPPENPLDSRFFYTKQLRILAVGMAPERGDTRGFLRFNERTNLKYLAELLHAGRLDAASLVSGTYPASEIEQAYRDLLARDRRAVTYLLRWHDDP